MSRKISKAKRRALLEIATAQAEEDRGLLALLAIFRAMRPPRPWLLGWRQ